ncbi:NUDIX hydrolase [Flaviaesturariibacter amylovorans]|uniref:NUDIX domain-containing protein n=1 Tax=Flaviaesturariibacter amylovorans TaxID=1084520 RepID=A0ABP8HQA1_9BACT
MPKRLLLKNAEIEKATHSEYFNIGLSVDCVIFGYEDKQLKVLLIESDLEEFRGMYSLLGDLVRPSEDLDEAPYRVLIDRTGLKDVYLEQVHTFGGLNRHPSGRVVTTAYYSLIDVQHHELQITEHEVHWHAVNDIKNLAFDHKLILDTCLARLRQQVMEEPIVFNLLQEKFSLRQLQDLYEAILGIELDRRNFRKRITLKNWLVDLNEMEEDVPHRPGKLYKLRTQLRREYRMSDKQRMQKLVV